MSSDLITATWEHVVEDERGREGAQAGTYSVEIGAGWSGSIVLDPVQRRFFLRGCGLLAPDTLEHCLNNLVIPRLLALDGHLVLHCGVVATPAGAVGFLGQSGCGKSTLTASLHARGLKLMGDDAARLDPHGAGWLARPLYPSLRLFPDSLGRVLSDVRETKPMAEYSAKLCVPFDAGPGSAPLRALFRLTDPGDEIRVTRLPPAAACMAIVANAFALDPEDAQETRRRFARAAEVARTIPVHDLTYPRDYDALPQVHDAILATLEQTLDPA